MLADRPSRSGAIRGSGGAERPGPPGQQQQQQQQQRDGTGRVGVRFAEEDDSGWDMHGSQLQDEAVMEAAGCDDVTADADAEVKRERLRRAAKRAQGIVPSAVVKSWFGVAEETNPETGGQQFVVFAELTSKHGVSVE